jgi:ABC-type nitrate/sulfonate/bicarbonate transport system substrate-binding protein
MSKSLFCPSLMVGVFFLWVHSSGLFAQEPLRAGTIFSATQAPLWAAREGRFFEKYGIKNLERPAGDSRPDRR